MLKNRIGLKGFFILHIFIIYLFFSIIIFMKVSKNYYDNNKEKIVNEMEYSAGVTKEYIEKTELQLINEARMIANYEPVFFAFKEGKLLTNKWEFQKNEAVVKTKDMTPLDYSKLLSNVINFMYQIGIGHIEGEKMLQIFDKNLNSMANTYDFPEKFKDKGTEKYLDAALGGRTMALSVDASEISIITEREGDLIIKGIAPIGKYARFGNNSVYGLVTVSLPVNGRYLEEVKKTINHDIVVIKENKIIVSTLIEESRVKNISVKLEPKARDFFYQELNINGDISGYSFFSIKNEEDKIIAYVGVGKSLKSSQLLYRHTVIEFIIFEIAALLIMVLTFYIILKNEYKPFKVIMDGLVHIQKGNYNKKIDIDARKELRIIIDGINNLSNVVSIREKQLKEMNVILESKVEERTAELKKMFEKMQSIEKMVSMIYTEKDEIKTMAYILGLLVSGDGMGYKKAVFMKYETEKERVKPYIYCENESVLVFKENDKNIDEFSYNIKKEGSLSRAFNERKIYNLTGTGEKLFIRDDISFEKFIIFPIYYGNTTFGTVVVEKSMEFNQEEFEIMTIFSDNIAIYLENIRLQKEEVKNSELKTLLKLSSAIVHEVRTPITTIRGFSSMLAKKYPDEEKIQNYTNKIIKETRRIDSMASDLLSYAEGTDGYVVAERMNINELMKEVISDMEKDLESNECIVLFDSKTDVINYMGDIKKIKKIFENIIKNSVEASKGYEDIIRIKTEREMNGNIKIIFEDNGIGVDAAIISKIFEPLVTTKIQGTGLGLTIVKNILKLHNDSTIVILPNYKPCGTIVEIELKNK